MRYPKDHKEQARRHLVAASGRHVKKHGYATSGVDALAASAGVTVGSLYKHFDTKNALFAELLGAEIRGTVAMFSGMEAGDLEALLKASAAYTSLRHVRNPDTGCPLPALAAEVARSPDDVRSAFEQGLLEFQQTLSGLTGSSETAWTLIAQNVGAVMLARAMQGEAHQRDLLEAVRGLSARLLKEGVATARTQAGAPGTGRRTKRPPRAP